MEKFVSGNSVDEVVDEFYDFLLKTGYCTLQEYDPDRPSLDEFTHHPEMFTCRIQTSSAKSSDSFFICGNTTASDNNEMILEEGDCAVNFDRIYVFKANEVAELKSCLKNLLNHWIEAALADGGYMMPNQTKEEEIALICHQMLLWDETQRTFTYYGDPKNAAARYEKAWFSCREGFSTNTPKGV